MKKLEEALSMGTSIWIYVEKKVKGEWIPAQGLLKDESGEPNLPLPDMIYSGRDFLLFDFLAGFTTKEAQYFEAKGLPSDISPEIKKIFERFWPDVRLSSYLTLKELESVDWDCHTVKCHGYVHEEYQEIFEKELAKPIDKRNYSLIDALKYSDALTGRQYKWEAPIKYAFRKFYKKAVENLILYWEDWDYEDDEDFDPSKVRIVFWFSP
ncbi:MAG: hypothetical protein ACFFDI_15375 [Promethearchaeota archaeon]